jgi:hypothetical protein
MRFTAEETPQSWNYMAVGYEPSESKTNPEGWVAAMADI